MAKTIAQLINGLKRHDQNSKVISNIYSADDIREGIAGYMGSGVDDLYKMTDDEILSLFGGLYSSGEDEIYWSACRMAAENVEQKLNKEV